MHTYHKRKRFLILFTIIAVFSFSFLLSSCTKREEVKENFNKTGLIVKFLDVGQGDSTLIRLPDNKVLLFDTGASSNKNKEKLLLNLKAVGNKIDYLILSHPDKEHYGNTVEIIKNCTIKKAYIPFILDDKVYPDFSSVINLLKEKETEVVISTTQTNISNGEYEIVFLSPDRDGKNSPYPDFNALTIPNDRLADRVSPIIYLEYKGARFILTADADKSVEELVLTNYSLGLYNHSKSNGEKVVLENIDFYKLSSHGGTSGNSLNFIKLLSPKNAIVSVGSRNSQSYPSTIALSNLYNANKEYNLYRTDRDKTIIINVDENGKYNVSFEQ